MQIARRSTCSLATEKVRRSCVIFDTGTIFQLKIWHQRKSSAVHPIPDICHFFDTGTIFQFKIWHKKYSPAGEKVHWYISYLMIFVTMHQVEFLYWCAVLMSVIGFRAVWQTVLLSRSLNPSWHKVDARLKSPNDWKWTQYRGGWQGWLLSWQRVLKTARSCAPLDLSSKSATMRIDWEPLSERIHLQCIDLRGFIENKCTIHVLCQQRVRYNFVSIIQQICISHLC